MTVAVAILMMVAIFGTLFATGVFDVTDEPEGDEPFSGRDEVECGKSATLNINSYDLAGNSESEVYPSYYIFDKDGNLLVDGASANTTSTTTCNELTLYGAGEDASYYIDSGAKEIESESVTVKLEGYKIVTESNLAITGYDDALSGLTAETNSNKSAEIDYALGDFGADECNTYNFKFKNGEADSSFRLGAICVGWGGDVEDVILSDSDWEKGYLPEELSDATITTHNDTNTAKTGDWKRCYVPTSGKYKQFDEWDSEMFEFTVCATSTAPVENTGDFGVINFFDVGTEKGKDGKVYEDFYVHDDDEEVTDVGMSEDTVSSIGALHSSVSFELQ